MRTILLAEPLDPTAAAVSAVLTQRHGHGAVLWITPAQLTGEAAWSHALFTPLPSNQITDGWGAPLLVGANDVILNLLGSLPDPLSGTQLGEAADAEASYRMSEWYALLLSWLQSLPCPVINRPSPHALGGPVHSEAGWQVLAARADLPTTPLRLTSSTRRFADRVLAYSPLEATGAMLSLGTKQPLLDVPGRYTCPRRLPAGSVTVIGTHAEGSFPELHSACLQLARLAGADLLTLEFDGIGREAARDEQAALGSGQPEEATIVFAGATARVHALEGRRLAMLVDLVEQCHGVAA